MGRGLGPLQGFTRSLGNGGRSYNGGRGVNGNMGNKEGRLGKDQLKDREKGSSNDVREVKKRVGFNGKDSQTEGVDFATNSKVTEEGAQGSRWSGECNRSNGGQVGPTQSLEENEEDLDTERILEEEEEEYNINDEEREKDKCTEEEQLKGSNEAFMSEEEMEEGL